MLHGRAHGSMSESEDGPYTKHHYHNPRSHLPRSHVYSYYITKGHRSRRSLPLCSRACLWLMACSVFILVFVFVVILPLRYSVKENKENLDLAPVDTTIISFSRPFCAKLILHSPETPVADFPIIATISLLKREPLLTKKHVSGFSRESLLSVDQYEFWKLFLYPGSSASYSACSVQNIAEPWGTFYLVKSEKNFERWKSDHSRWYIEHLSIESTCGENSNSTFSFEADREDHYYFIVYSTTTTQSTLAITFTFNRLLYEANSSSILTECSIALNDSSSSSCHVRVPLSSASTALLELDPLTPDLVDWEANIVVDVQCGARTWLYAVIALSGVSVGVLLVMSAVLVFLSCCRKKRVRQHTVKEDTSLVGNDNNNNNTDNNNNEYNDNESFYDSCTDNPK